MTMLHILLFTLLGFMFLSISLGNWVFQTNLDRVAQAQDGSRRLSEAVLHVAIARLLKDPKIVPATMPSLNLTLPSYPQGEGLLALDEGAAAKLRIPLSINNLQGGTGLPGRGDVVVQAETASLVGVGRYLGRETRTEVILNIPAFPYVVASSVPLRSVNGLQVFGLASPAALSAGFANIPDDQKVPGHIITDAADPAAGVSALQLNGDKTTSRATRSHAAPCP